MGNLNCVSLSHSPWWTDINRGNFHSTCFRGSGVGCQPIVDRGYLLISKCEIMFLSLRDTDQSPSHHEKQSTQHQFTVAIFSAIRPLHIKGLIIFATLCQFPCSSLPCQISEAPLAHPAETSTTYQGYYVCRGKATGNECMTADFAPKWTKLIISSVDVVRLV